MRVFLAGALRLGLRHSPRSGSCRRKFNETFCCRERLIYQMVNVHECLMVRHCPTAGLIPGHSLSVIGRTGIIGNKTDTTRVIQKLL